MEDQGWGEGHVVEDNDGGCGSADP